MLPQSFAVHADRTITSPLVLRVGSSPSCLGHSCHHIGDMIWLGHAGDPRRTLKEFWAHHRHAEGPIRAWLAIAATSHWANPAEIKRQFGSTVDFRGRQSS